MDKYIYTTKLIIVLKVLKWQSFTTNDHGHVNQNRINVGYTLVHAYII